MKKRALICVFDKSGIVPLAETLAELGYEIISTGKTAEVLRQNSVPVTALSSVTGFPECLDGRLKTLHPAIHGGILALRSNPDHMAQLELLGIEAVDIVVNNLYPFKQTILKEGVQFDEAIENIDIGGPAMLRAAAKNWRDVCAVVDPSDYPEVIACLRSGGVPKETRLRLAQKVFEHTAHYDALIARYLARHCGDGGYPETLTLTFEKVQGLCYGENPHQRAAFYRDVECPEGSVPTLEQVHGSELSFNNVADLNAAIAIVKGMDTPCAAVVKHTGPCGAGWGESIAAAWMKAGGVAGGCAAALNRECDAETAALISAAGIDALAAPAYSEDALEILSANEGLRVVIIEKLGTETESYEDYRRVYGGLLIQNGNTDNHDICWGTGIDSETRAELEKAWRVCRFAKSCAVVLARDGRVTGIGMGRPGYRAALEQALAAAGEDARGSVMAVDGSLSDPEYADLVSGAGIKAIIQPGGGAGYTARVEEAGIQMVFTRERQFLH